MCWRRFEFYFQIYALYHIKLIFILTPRRYSNYYSSIVDTPTKFQYIVRKLLFVVVRRTFNQVWCKCTFFNVCYYPPRFYINQLFLNPKLVKSNNYNSLLRSCQIFPCTSIQMLICRIYFKYWFPISRGSCSSIRPAGFLVILSVNISVEVDKIDRVIYAGIETNLLKKKKK